MSSGDRPQCDILIVGAGIFGTSTAYHLAQSHHDPSRITVLDRSPVPSPRAASSDINKIVRADYSSPFYMDLAYEAMDAWTTWPLLKPHFHQTGWVALDERGSDLSERIRENFRRSGRPDTSADITLEEVKSSWGGALSEIDTAGYDKAYANSSAGWVDASAAVEAMMAAALARGVRYEVGEVSSLECVAGKLTGVRTTDDCVLSGTQILLATGAWTPWLMAPLEHTLGIPASLSIQTQCSAAGVCVVAFDLSPAEATLYNRMPILIYGSAGEVMPPTTTTARREFKFTNAHTFTNAVHHPATNHPISVPSDDQHHVPPALQAQSLEIIRQRVPAMLRANRRPDSWRLCWDAISPDQNQLICRHPDARLLPNLYFATAGSFHSWKFLPVIGRYVVNVLEGKSNGEAKDAAWRWKTSWSGRGAHEKTLPRADLQDFT